MNRTFSLYQRAFTFADLIDFVQAGLDAGAPRDTPVSISQARSYSHPTDPGGEVSISLVVAA